MAGSLRPSRQIVSSCDDGMLLEKIRDSAKATAFKRLWAGDWQAAGYGSQSEADLALCATLAFGLDETLPAWTASFASPHFSVLKNGIDMPATAEPTDSGPSRRPAPDVRKLMATEAPFRDTRLLHWPSPRKDHGTPSWSGNFFRAGLSPGMFFPPPSRTASSSWPAPAQGAPIPCLEPSFA